MKLEPEVASSFKTVRIFKEHTSKINHFNFSPSGNYLISCCADDDQINIYDCQKGSFGQKINCRKYGCDLVTFTHYENHVMHNSTKINHDIRQLDLSTNTYLRYCPGHEKKVISLSTNPKIVDSYLSTSDDETLRLWDFKSPSPCYGTINLASISPAAYDPEGLIFAAGINSKSIDLFDLRNFSKGPFNSFKFSQERECQWTNLKFSGDGRVILLSTNTNAIKIIDAFDGIILKKFTDYLNEHQAPIEASLSPDSQFLFSGSTDGRVHIWKSKTGQKLCILNGDHPSPVHCIQFNPRYVMFASACSQINFWVPSLCGRSKIFPLEKTYS